MFNFGPTGKQETISPESWDRRYLIFDALLAANKAGISEKNKFGRVLIQDAYINKAPQKFITTLEDAYSEGLF